MCLAIEYAPRNKAKSLREIDLLFAAIRSDWVVAGVRWRRQFDWGATDCWADNSIELSFWAKPKDFLQTQSPSQPLLWPTINAVESVPFRGRTQTTNWFYYAFIQNQAATVAYRTAFGIKITDIRGSWLSHPIPLFLLLHLVVWQCRTWPQIKWLFACGI